MMKQAILCLIILITSTLGDSDSFKFTLDSGKKKLSNMEIYMDDGSIYIGDTTNTLNGTIQDDGTIDLGSGEYVGIVKNYFTVENSTIDAALTFEIDKNGHLKYNDKTKFKAIPYGNNNIWILGSDDADSSLDDTYEIKIKCLKANGKKASKFSSPACKNSLHYGIFTVCLVLVFILNK